MAVTIGIDPHKGSHTAVALDEHETVLGQLWVRSGPDQLGRLTEWAKARQRAPGRSRTPRGLVTSSPNSSSAPAKRWSTSRPNWPPGPPARQRRPQQERPQRRPVCRCGRPTSKTLVGGDKRGPRRRHEAVGQAAQGPHRFPYPGGQPPARRHLGARPRAGTQARNLRKQSGPAARGLRARGAIAAARKELAEELLGDLRRLDIQLAELKERLAAVVAASGTTTTKIFGVGPVVAAITVGLTRDVRRFAERTTSPLTTAAPRSKSPPAQRSLPALDEGEPPTEPRSPHGGRDPGAPPSQRGTRHYERKVAEGKTGKEALRALKRRISDALYTAMVADARRERDEGLSSGGPGGQTGNGSVASAAGSHPAKPALRPSHSRAKPKARPSREAARSPPPRNSEKNLQSILTSGTKRTRFGPLIRDFAAVDGPTRNGRSVLLTARG